MELKTFIKQSLIEIVEAVSEAGKTVAEHGARLNPNAEGWADDYSGHVNPADLQQVDFEVAVTAEDTTGIDGKAGIKVFSFEIGGGGSHQAAVGSVSKIRFSVPILLPHSKRRP